MRREIREEWVKRLRSGKYEQGKGKLHTADGKYCCLGVLCAMAEEEGVVRKALRNGMYHYGPAADDQGAETDLPYRQGYWSAIVLPDAVVGWAEISRDPKSQPFPTNPLLTVPDKSSDEEFTAADYNDDGKPFDWIADKIEASSLL